VAEVDPFDDSIIRYVIRRHAYDPETKHFKWNYEKAFNKRREYEKSLRAAFDELGARQIRGEAHFKEQLIGEVLEIGNFRNAKTRRQERKLEGQFYVASFRNNVIFFILSRLLPQRRSRRIDKFFRKFLTK
jgi:hypothetical protein